VKRTNFQIKKYLTQRRRDAKAQSYFEYKSLDGWFIIESSKWHNSFEKKIFAPLRLCAFALNISFYLILERKSKCQY